MKIKLKKFGDFASDILPHEAQYLMDIQRFDDKVKLGILDTILHNCNHSNMQRSFDPDIDKRKYSNLKNWIVNQLEKNNVDKHFEWINEMDRKVMTDSIDPEDERELLKAIQESKPADYYFVKFFELILNLRQYLLIRLRYNEHKIANDFILDNQHFYEKSIRTSNKMHEVSVDIINQYSLNNTESKQWEQWLLDVFYDDSLDGRNRYFAVVRLTFMYFNYREYDKLKDLYEDLDKMLKKGMFYARRILFNYYANSVLIHSKYDVLQRAEEFGYLSIKQKNADHLKYLNNYSAILLRQGKIDQALSLMKQALPEMRNTDNFHNKIGFAAFYIKCLNLNGQPDDAARFGESFLRTFRQEVIMQRWHVFFVAYLQSLIMQEKYEELLKIVKRNKLLDKDRTFQSSAIYLPTIIWYESLAGYMENRISQDKLISNMVTSAQEHMGNPHKSALIEQLMDELYDNIPFEIKQVRSILNSYTVNA